MQNKEKCGRTCNGMANFMYYSHPIFILILERIPLLKGQNTLIFILTIAITSTIGYLIYKMNNKLINRFIY